MKDDNNYIHKYYAPFYHQKIMKMNFKYQNMIQQSE